MPKREQKSENPEINSREKEKRRGRPTGRKNSSIRADRLEACRAVAVALVEEPAAKITVLAEKAFPEETGDEKAKKRVHERTRQALAAMKKLDDNQLAELLEDSELAAKVREALQTRREEEEGKKKEREEKLRLTPARVFLQRLLRYPEVREEFAAAVRQHRQQLQRMMIEMADALEKGEVTEAEYMWKMDELVSRAELLWAFALAPDQISLPLDIPHFCPGRGSSVFTGGEAISRTKVELSLHRRFSSFATITFRSAINILKVVKTLRKALREKDPDRAELARQELRSSVSTALAEMGWGDPELWACQALETPTERIKRENATLKEVVTKMFAKLPTSLTRKDVESWPEPWEFRPRQVPDYLTQKEIKEMIKQKKLIPILHCKDEITKLAETICGYKGGERKYARRDLRNFGQIGSKPPKGTARRI